MLEGAKLKLETFPILRALSKFPLAKQATINAPFTLF